MAAKSTIPRDEVVASLGLARRDLETVQSTVVVDEAVLDQCLELLSGAQDRVTALRSELGDAEMLESEVETAIADYRQPLEATPQELSDQPLASRVPMTQSVAGAIQCIDAELARLQS